MIYKKFILKFIRQRISNLTINVAEKNDSAKMISKLLSNDKVITNEGLSKFNKLYKFKYELDGKISDMIMTSVSGHLMNLAFPHNMSNWETVNPISLFDSPTEKKCAAKMENIKKTLEKIAVECHTLIIWTDCDREGENIGMEIVEVCLAVNSKINVKRARFSEITTESVTHAINNLVDMDLRISRAVDVRQQLDLKSGAAFTRLQTLCLQKKVPNILMNKVISYGSCQFPTLGFVVERYKEVSNFISKPFWKIILIHEKNNTSSEYNWVHGKSFDENVVSNALKKITMNGSLACVIKVTNKTKYKKRPVALDTIQMEKLASEKLKINPKLTMQIAEKLYSQGYISYPRTETNMFSKEINLKNFVVAQILDTRWGDFAKDILLKGISPHNGKKTDKAHPPIIPLKSGLKLDHDENRLFELITRHFLACLSNDAKGHQIELLIDCISKNYGKDIWKSDKRPVVSGLGEEFILTGTSVTEKNYLNVYPYENWSDKSIETYRLGEIFEPTSLFITKGNTSPPSFLTEGDLISLMDKHGIGTDATHAEHIDKIKTREYACYNGQKNNYLVPSKLGIGLVNAYNLMGIDLARPILRSKFETELKEICTGKREPNVVLRKYLNEYKSIFLDTVKNLKTLENIVLKYLHCGDPSEIRMPTSFLRSQNEKEIIPNLVIDNMKQLSISSDVFPISNAPNCFCGEPAISKSENDLLLYVCRTSKCKYSQLNENKNVKDIKSLEAKVTIPLSENENKESITKCFCEKPAILLSVLKDSGNKGRKYYCCRQTIRCQFFKWYSDESNLKFQSTRSHDGNNED